METETKEFCPKCGAELEDDAIFCSECGARLTKQEEPTQNEAPKEERTAAQLPETAQEEIAKAEAPQDETSQEASTPKEDASKTNAPEEIAPVEVLSSAAPQKEEPRQTTESTLEEAPQSTQKFCLHCGTSLPMDAMFCQKCGTKQVAQPQPQPSNVSPAQPQGTAAAQTTQPTTPSNINIDVEAFKAGVNKGGLHHVLLAASVVIGISVFLPLVSIAGMANLKLMEISSVLAVFILVVAAGTAYASMLGKYEIPVVTGHSFLLVLLFGVFKYQSKLSEMETNFWTALAKNAFRADWGFYLMPIAIIGLIFGGLMAGLQQTGKAPELPSLVERWKQVMLQSVKIHTMNFQGITWSIAIAIVMIFVAMQSSGAKQLGL